MTEKKKWIILSFLGMFFVFQTYAIITYKNVWPFSALTMYANVNSKHFKVRALLETESGLQPIPQLWFSPFGRYRTMALLGINVPAFRDKNDKTAEFILDDTGRRMESFCRNEPKRGVHALLFQYCQDCSSTEQNQLWETVKRVKLNCP